MGQGPHFSAGPTCSHSGVTALTVMAALGSLSRRLDVGEVSAITGVLSAAGQSTLPFSRCRGFAG